MGAEVDGDNEKDDEEVNLGKRVMKCSIMQVLCALLLTPTSSKQSEIASSLNFNIFDPFILLSNVSCSYL